MNRKTFFSVLAGGFFVGSEALAKNRTGFISTENRAFSHNKKSVAAAEGILSRMTPALVGKVRFETIPDVMGQDVFELQSKNGKTVIRGNNGVSMASGLNWYLKYYCHCQITLRSRQLNLPDKLPEIKEIVRIVSPHKYRYYFNYCCFSYTLAWWDWKDWERMIDLMALYGVNAPLSVTGQEGVWLNVGKRLGLSEEQMQDFFVGPAFLPFGWMGCVDGFAGPLPQSWIADHVELEKKILTRERELGMTPILQGFTGHAPAKLQEVRPDVNLVKLTSWYGFPSTWFIDPATPFFREIGEIFVEEQTKLFGTNHLYASDTFIEMPPPSNDTTVLRKMGESIYAGMKAADPEAIWVLQSWMFLHDKNFWQKPQRDAFLRSVQQDKLLLIDLFCENNPVWSKTEAFSGQPWIWCIIQNFGGTVSLHGAIDNMATDLKKAMDGRGGESGKLSGIGYIMEGLGWNPLIDEFQSDLVWRTDVPNTSEWIEQFVKRRYGQAHVSAQKAWQTLHQTAYQHAGRRDNIITVRPAIRLTSGLEVKRELLPAWKMLLDAAPQLAGERTYQFDMANISRETLGSLSAVYYQQMVAAYETEDREQLKAAAEKMNTLILDLDRLLACDNQFLLGTWLESAKRWGHTEEEKKYYEWNARNQISLWGTVDYGHCDYARKEWSGMFRDYYAGRWNLFYREMDKSLETDTPWDGDAFEKKMRVLQVAWGKETTSFPTEPSGENAVDISGYLLEKYEEDFAFSKTDQPSRGQ